MSDSAFANHVKMAWRQVRAKVEKKKDPIRSKILGGRTQGYIVDVPVILKEISRKESPFKPLIEAGGIADTDLSSIAAEISNDFWNELKITAKRNTKVYKLENGKVPANFGEGGKFLASCFNNNTKIMYYRGTTGDFQESFRGQIIKPTIERIKKRANPLNYLRIFVSPDKPYEKEINELEKQINDAGKGAKASVLQQRRKRARDNFYKEKGIDPKTIWQGIEIGHTFGAKASAASGFLSNRHDVVHHLDNLKLHPYLENRFPELITVLDDIITHDIEAEWERKYRDDSVAGKVTLLIPESYVNNKVTGGSAGQASQNLYNEVLRQLIADITKIEGSPSYEQLVENLIEDLFLGKKPKTGKRTAKAKVRDRSKRSIPITNIPTPRVKVTRKSENKEIDSESVKPDLQSLIGLINSKLHDKIRENMGKGGSKQILNYRTGRFAKSAKVKDLYGINEKRALGAKVKYMRYPYGVFEPGGRLHKPGRDPHRIFGRSIRQILQEEKIANLRRVKVRLDG